MLDILRFVMGSFWHWLGTLFLIVAFGAVVTPLISIKITRSDDA